MFLLYMHYNTTECDRWFELLPSADSMPFFWVTVLSYDGRCYQVTCLYLNPAAQWHVRNVLDPLLHHFVRQANLTSHIYLTLLLGFLYGMDLPGLLATLIFHIFPIFQVLCLLRWLLCLYLLVSHCFRLLKHGWRYEMKIRYT